MNTGDFSPEIRVSKGDLSSTEPHPDTGPAITQVTGGVRSPFNPALGILSGMQGVDNLPPEVFQAGMSLLFQALGYQVRGCERTADGLLLILACGQSRQVAYCLPTFLAVSSVEVALCAQAMDKYNAGFGFVVTRGWFLPGAMMKAGQKGIELVDGARLQEVFDVKG